MPKGWCILVLIALAIGGFSGSLRAEEVAAHPAVRELDRLSAAIREKYLGQKGNLGDQAAGDCKMTVVELQQQYIDAFKKNAEHSQIVRTAAEIERRVYQSNSAQKFCLRRDITDQQQAVAQLSSIDPGRLAKEAANIAYCAPILKARAEGEQRGTTHMAKIQMLQQEIDALLELRFLALEVGSEAAFAADRRERVLQAITENLRLCQK